MTEPASVPNLQVRDFTCVGTCNLPAASVGNSQFTGSGSSSLDSTKVEQQRTAFYSQPAGSWTTAEKKPVHLFRGAVGSVGQLKAKLPTQCNAGSTVTVTWYLSGVSIGSVSFSNSDANNAVKSATPSTTAAVVDDDLQVDVAVTGSNPGKGLMTSALTKEYGS